MAIVVEIVLEFEIWIIVELICLLHQVQGLFDFLFSWSCGSCNDNVQMKFLGTPKTKIKNIVCDFFFVF